MPPQPTPLIIEAAICPFSHGAGLRWPGMAVQAKECLAAGATIIHHHHDYRLDAGDTAVEMITLGKSILADFPDAAFYGDFVKGDTLREKNSHLVELKEADALTMIAVDPGRAVFGGLRSDGVPTTNAQVGGTYEGGGRSRRICRETRYPTRNRRV